MRHRRRGRSLSRSPSHRDAMLRNLAASLVLTERETDDLDPNPPEVKGRVITTLTKAKEVRPLVEKCITIARRALPDLQRAEEHGTSAARNSAEWRAWRTGPEWRKWCAAMAPVVAARRRVLRLLGDKQAMRIVFSSLAPRFAERPGGYTRILKLAKPRLGDAGPRVALEFAGVRDRVVQRSERPAFAEPEGAAPAAASG